MQTRVAILLAAIVVWGVLFNLYLLAFSSIVVTLFGNDDRTMLVSLRIVACVLGVATTLWIARSVRPRRVSTHESTVSATGATNSLKEGDAVEEQNGISSLEIAIPIVRVPRDAAKQIVGIPIIGMTKEQRAQHKERTRVRQVLGTAFPIDRRHLITAAHVLKATKNDDDFVLGFLRHTGLMGYCEIEDFESFDDRDIALIRARHDLPFRCISSWCDGPVFMGADVQCYGYPEAIEPGIDEMHHRLFEGHIVGHTRVTTLSASPHGIELSFPAPSGLSGAPVMEPRENGPPLVVGVILGSKSLTTTVFESTEIISEERESIIQRIESLRLGLALQSTEVLRLNSNLLGGTIGDYLGKVERLHKRKVKTQRLPKVPRPEDPPVQ